MNKELTKSLYVHVPFCNTICTYCDFKKQVYNSKLVDSYLIYLKETLKKDVKNYELETIYIGGGTPTSLNINQLNELLLLLKPYSNNVIEYTIESNIENINKELIDLLVSFGINRISLGVQSLNSNLLKIMNRKHTKDDVFNALKIISDNKITNITIDMMYGFNELSFETFLADLTTVCRCKLVKHISLYSLTVEKNTYLGKINYQTIDNYNEAKFYIEAKKILSKYKFEQYEVSNFSKVGYQSLHNKCYWKYHNFYGVGKGASGKIDNIRYEDGGECVKLNTKDIIFETIMMNLRLVEGINIKEFNERYTTNILDIYKEAINKHISLDNLIIDQGYLKTTEYGMLNLHDILVDFL